MSELLVLTVKVVKYQLPFFYHNVALRDQLWDWQQQQQQQPYLNGQQLVLLCPEMIGNKITRGTQLLHRLCQTKVLTKYWLLREHLLWFSHLSISLVCVLMTPSLILQRNKGACSMGVRLDSGKQVSQSIVSMLSSSWGMTDSEFHSAFLFLSSTFRQTVSLSFSARLSLSSIFSYGLQALSHL